VASRWEEESPGRLSLKENVIRVYGRIPNGSGGLSWVVIQTDANGNSDLVYVTALCQVLLLNLLESPFWGSSGIPAQQAVNQQIAPDYYVSLIQQQYSQYFASLQITKQVNPTPTYQVFIITHQGTVISASVPIAT
jgi:hypothetical protein